MAEENKQKPVPMTGQPDFEEHSDDEKENKIKQYKKQATRSLVLAFTTLIAIIAVCIAWFVSNSRVSMTGASISAGDDAQFQLASVGEIGAHDGKTPEEFRITGKNWSIGSGTTMQEGTSTESSSQVLWRLSDQSNIGNNGTNGTAKGISPGSSGKLQFYVIPKNDDEITIDFLLNLIPLKEDEKGVISQYSEEDSSSDTLTTLNKLLRGHILLTYSCTDNANGAVVNNKWIPCNKEEFSLTLKGKNPHLVTLDWQWPYQWSDVGAEMRDNLETISQYQDYVFYSESDTDSSDAPVEESIKNQQYNNGDMFIGENVTWLLVQLSAHPA